VSLFAIYAAGCTVAFWYLVCAVFFLFRGRRDADKIEKLKLRMKGYALLKKVEVSAASHRVGQGEFEVLLGIMKKTEAKNGVMATNGR
jgi:hypothetical protein